MATTGTLKDLVRGDTWVFDITFSRISGSIDLTVDDTEVWFTLKESYGDPDPGLAQKTVGAGINVLGATSIRVIIDPTDTESLGDTVHQIYYDVQIKEGASGQISTPLDSTITLKPDVTRTRT